MSHQLFTTVSLEEQAIITGGDNGIYVEEDNYSEFFKDTLKQVATTSANHDGAETAHALDLSEVDAFANVFKIVEI